VYLNYWVEILSLTTILKRLLKVVGNENEGGSGKILTSDCGDRRPFVSVFSRHLVLKLSPFRLLQPNY
jgi:hypothetical protein